MKRSSLALLVFLLFLGTTAYGQSLRRTQSPDLISKTESSNDETLAVRAIAALQRLDNDVLVYRSLGDFEERGKLARVSFETFRNDLREVTAEVNALLSGLAQSRLKSEIKNALDSYRDGAFWWQKIDQSRVVHVSALTSTEISRPPADAAFLSTVPYTVAIHWRQAAKFLKRAEAMLNASRK